MDIPDQAGLVPFPVINEIANDVRYTWTADEWMKLISVVKTGADLIYPDEAQNILWSILRGMHLPQSFDAESDDCYNYPPYAPFITYNLYNPYSDPTFVPDGYLVNPYIAGGYPLFEPDDLIVDLLSFPIFANWWDLLTGNLPRIEIHTVGDGQIELNLLNIIQGGFAIIKVGSPPNILDVIGGIYEAGIRVVDLGIDVAIPTELDVVHAEEVNIVVGAGVSETTYITFIPVVDDAFPPFGLPVRFGGGLRDVGLCGFENAGVIMGITDLRVVGCNIETFEGGVWTVKGSLSACLQPVIDDFDEHVLIFEDTFTDLDDMMLQNDSRIDVIEATDPDLNNYPAPPTEATDPDALCGAVWNVAEELEALCQDALADAQVITLEEWLNGILGIGGFEASIVVGLWNLAYANINPTLSADLTSAIPDIAEILYCVDLDIATAITDIQGSALPSDVKTFYEAAINSVMASNWGRWVFIGAQDTSRDCSGFSCGTWCYRFDVSTGFSPFTIAYGSVTGRGIDNAHWAVGNNTFSGWQLTLNPNNVAGLTQVRVQTHHISVGIENSTILNMVIPQGAGTGGYTDIKSGGWNGVPVDADFSQDCSDWDDILVYGTTAAKANDMYASAGEGYLEFIELSGTGANPFGSDNCS